MNRHKNIAWRKLPLCEWCFLPVDKAGKKFCSPFCTDAAQAWKNDAHWRFVGREVAKSDQKKHFEKTIAGEEDYEFLVESDNADDMGV